MTIQTTLIDGNVSKFLKDETYDKKEVLRAINYSTPHRLVLTGLMESGVLSKRFNRKIDEMLKIA